MRLDTTARTARIDDKRAAARVLARSLVDNDVTQDELARCVGVGHALAQKWVDRDRLETPCVATVRGMPAAIKRDLLLFAGEPQFTPAEVPASLDDRSELLEHVADLVERVSDALTTHARVLADGIVTPSECESGVRKIDGAMAQLAAARERLRAMSRVRAVK